MVQGIGETNLQPQKKQIQGNKEASKNIHSVTIPESSSQDTSVARSANDVIDIPKSISGLFKDIEDTLNELNRLQVSQEEQQSGKVEDLHNRLAESQVKLQNILSASQPIRDIKEAQEMSSTVRLSLSGSEPAYDLSSDNVLRLLK